jgi:hypothetical protein
MIDFVVGLGLFCIAVVIFWNAIDVYRLRRRVERMERMAGELHERITCIQPDYRNLR